MSWTAQALMTVIESLCLTSTGLPSPLLTLHDPFLLLPWLWLVFVHRTGENQLQEYACGLSGMLTGGKGVSQP